MTDTADTADDRGPADLVVSVRHRRPVGHTPGEVSTAVYFTPGLSPVQRIQLTEAAMSALADAHTSAMAQHLGEPEETS
jgi:hypothetical protein